MHISELYRALKPLRLRVFANSIIDCMLWGLCVGLGVGLFMAIGALLVPVTFMVQKMLVSFIVIFVISIIAALFMLPKDQKVLAEGDALGLKERLVTAFEYKDEDNPVANIQRFDALKAVKALDVKNAYPLRADRKKIFAILALSLVMIITLMVPAPNREIAKERERIQQEIKREVKRIEKEREKLAANSRLTPKVLKELDRQLDVLAKDLRKSENESEALKALARAQHRLGEIRQKSLDKDLARLGRQLSEFEATRELGKALETGESDAIKKQLEELEKALKTMNHRERQQLAEELKNISKEIDANPQLAAACQQLAQGMQDGQFSGRLAQLNTAISRLAQDPALRQSLQQLTQTLQQSKANLSAAGSGQTQNPTLVSRLGSPGQGNDSTGQSGNGSPDTEGSDGEKGNRSGAGSGSGSGQDDGSNGSGAGGKGAGSGTSHGSDDSGNQGPSTGGAEKSPGRKQVGDYEEIYTFKRLGGDGEISNVNGIHNNAGSVRQIQIENGSVTRGESRPYHEVLGQYKYEAMNSLSRTSIPSGMKMLVEEYFSSLEE